MVLGVVSSSWSSASMQLHGADHTSLSLECSGWSCGGWLSALSGVHLRARMAPSCRYELLDLTFLFLNFHLVLGRRLWFCFVCLLLGFLGGAKLSFDGLRCILGHLRNTVSIWSKIWPVLPKHKYVWAKTPLSRHKEQRKSLFPILIPERME